MGTMITMPEFNLFTPLIKLILNIVTQLASLILVPLGTLLSSFFPSSLNMESIIYSVSSVMNTLIGYMQFGLTILPSSFKYYLGVIIDIEIVWLAGSVTYYSFLLLYRWIKVLKFW